MPGMFKGKYGYCAPEQLDGGPVERRTDVFCLGIVLWECLTGVRCSRPAATWRPSTPCGRAGSSRRATLRPEVPASWTRS